MVISAFILLLITLFFFALTYKNPFSKTMSLYFFSIAIMTVVGILYITKISSYSALMKIDYWLYLHLDSIHLSLSQIARFYNIAFACYMLCGVFFIRVMYKFGFFKFMICIIPCIYFVVSNDPDTVRTMHINASLNTLYFNSIVNLSDLNNAVNIAALYTYMIAPFAALVHYYIKTTIFVKKKDALISGICLLILNIFVFAVFIHGPYKPIMFNHVNMAKLPAGYKSYTYSWLPIILLTLITIIMALTLILRPFKIFNSGGESTHTQSLTSINKNVSVVLHIYKNAFLGLTQQLELSKRHIKKGEYEASLRNIDIGQDIISSHTTMLNKILNSIGNTKVKFAVTELTDCIHSAIKKFNGLNTGINADFTTTDNSIKVYGDKYHLTEVFLNLLVNSSDALKYVTDREKILKISIICETDMVMVSVYDNGTGISKTNIRKVFQLFFSTKSNGSGVGLSYVSSIIKRHHGEIKIKSVPGSFTELQIVLPVYRQRKGQRLWTR